MKYLTLFALLFSAVAAFSQDQLFRKDNTKTDVKVLEITPTEIKYKLFTYQDGPTITVLKSDVALIIYQNGAHETFNTPAPQSQPMVIYRDDLTRNRTVQRHYEDSIKLAKYHEVVSTKNVVFLNLMEPLNGCFGVSYLREVADGLFHIYVPVAAGFSEPYFNQIGNSVFGISSSSYSGITNYRYNRKTFEGGLGFHIHTSGKRAVTHFIGPYIGISQFTGRYDSFLYDPNYYYGTQVYVPHNFVMNRYTFMLDNGILFRVHKNFNMMLMAGVGYRSDDYLKNNPKNYAYNNYDYYYGGSFPINSFKLNLSVGYRF